MGSAQPNIGLVRSPDPRYLEAFEGYFGDHSHSSPQLREEAVAMTGLQSGEQTASEDEDEDDDDDGEEEEEPKARRAFSYKPVR